MKLAKKVVVVSGLLAGVVGVGVGCGLGFVGETPSSSEQDAGTGSGAGRDGAVGTVDASGTVTADGGDAGDDAGDAGSDRALLLDGGGQFVRAQRTVQDDFTLELRVKTTTTGRTGTSYFDGTPLLWSDILGNHDDFALTLLGDKAAFGAKDMAVTGSTKITTGAWVHVAAVRTKTPGKLYLYVNGVPDGNGNGPNTSLTACPTLDLGGNLVDQRFLAGTIDEVRVWSVARSAAEILATWNVSLTGNEANLVSYWRLDDGAGTTASDSSGHGNVGLLAWPDAGAPPTWVRP